jgi:hypothetical protein
MGRCKYELLAPLEPALNQVRQLEGLIEKKPGIFYFKSQGFMHFHEKDGDIWADVRDGKNWGKPIYLPNKITKTFCKEFYLEVKTRLTNAKSK